MTSFHERQKSLFNHLKDAEDQCNFSKSNKAATPQDYGAIDKRTYRKVKHEMKQFRGRESIFKRPEANLRECLRAKTVPDFMKNPKKWVYYSLSDVTADQMSEASNTATALAHIRELEERELALIQDNSKQNDDFIFKKPTFHISSTVKKVSVYRDDTENITFKDNKVIMPEYVVGLSKKKEKKNKIVRRNSGGAAEEKKAELKLDHLFGDEEED